MSAKKRTKLTNLSLRRVDLVDEGDNPGAEILLAKAKWSAVDVNDFPDSSFAYVESGDKDDDGKTTPRSKRHLPYKDAGGTVDAAHVRNALARLEQTDIPATAKAGARKKLESAAKSVGVNVAKAGALTLGEVVSQREVTQALGGLYDALCSAVWNNIYGEGTPEEKAANIKTSIAQFAVALTAEVDEEFAEDAAMVVEGGDQEMVVTVEMVQKMADAALGRALRVVRKVTGQSLHVPAIDPAFKEKKMTDDQKTKDEQAAKDKKLADLEKESATAKAKAETDAAEIVTLKARIVELEKASETPEVIEKRKLEALPADIRQRLEENEAEVKKLREAGELVDFTKRAADLNVAGTTPDKLAPILKRIHRGGTTAEDAAEIERLFKSLSEVARQSSVFKTLGVSGGEQQDGSALVEVQKRVAKLMADEKLSYAEASARITQDRQLMERVAAEKAN